MLLETRRRKRALAVTAPSLARQQRRPPALEREDTTQHENQRRRSPGTGQEQLHQRRVEPVQQRAPQATPRTTTPTDRRLLLSRASRVQILLMERLRAVDMRRSRRLELLEEIVRLKKVMQELQQEVDATTRSLEQLEQLVHNLQGISFAPVTTLSHATY